MLWWTLRQLKSKRLETRRKAVREFGESRNPKAVEPLIALLKDSEFWLPRDAAKALGKIGDTRAVEPLIAVLQTSESSPLRLGKVPTPTLGSPDQGATHLPGVRRNARIEDLPEFHLRLAEGDGQTLAASVNTKKPPEGEVAKLSRLRSRLTFE